LTRLGGVLVANRHHREGHSSSRDDLEGANDPRGKSPCDEANVERFLDNGSAKLLPPCGAVIVAVDTSVAKGLQRKAALEARQSIDVVENELERLIVWDAFRPPNEHDFAFVSKCRDLEHS
jgi:hypothetical protein